MRIWDEYIEFIIKLVFIYDKVSTYLAVLSLGMGFYYTELTPVFKKHLYHRNFTKLLALQFPITVHFKIFFGCCWHFVSCVFKDENTFLSSLSLIIHCYTWESSNYFRGKCYCFPYLGPWLLSYGSLIHWFSV